MSRPIASEILAPVPYSSSSKARSRSGAGPSPAPAAWSRRSTSATEMAFGSRRGGAGGRTGRAGSCPASPSAAANACIPRTATTARPAELAASGG
jgi:hypothetical protein